MPLSSAPTHSIDEDLSLALQLSVLQDTTIYEEEQNFDLSEDDFTFDDREQDYDYGDIYLSPPTQNKSKRRKSKIEGPQSTQKLTPKPTPRPAPFTKIIQPIIDCPKPLVFPLEILEEVCYHSSQSTLRTSVRLVCKDWYTVSYQFIHRFGIWSPLSGDGSSQLLKQMNKKLDTLECWFNIDPYVPNSIKMLNQQLTRDRWEVFREAILAPFEEGTRSNNVVALKNSRVKSSQIQQQHQSHPIIQSSYKCLLHRIHSLSIRGCYIGFSEVFTSLGSRGGFKHLKSLIIDIHKGHRDISLFSLLDDCPNLVEFKVRVPHIRTKVHILRGDAYDLIPIEISSSDNTETTQLLVEPKSYDERYNLRIFDIENCQIRHFVFEKLISTCPHLRVLKANSLTRFGRDNTRQCKRIPIDHDKLLHHANVVCPLLESLDINFRGYPLHEGRAIKHIIQHEKYFPKSKRLSLSLNILDTNGLLQDMLNYKAVFERITLLEISPNDRTLHDPRFLDRILCLTPNLLDLKAPDYIFEAVFLHFPTRPVPTDPGRSPKDTRERKRLERYERMEKRKLALQRYQNSGVSLPKVEEPVVIVDRSRVWSCNNLRSLDMLVHGKTHQPYFHIFWFTSYIGTHRLFRNLVNLRLKFGSLCIGQLIEFPDDTKERDEKMNKIYQEYHPGKTPKHSNNGPRYFNYFAGLLGLRSIEFIRFDASQIPGMVHFSDFEFLRRKKYGETVIHVVSHDGDGGADDIYQDQSSEENCDEDDVPVETVWPRLQTLHIFYEENDVYGIDMITSHVEDIRPGIDFILRHKVSYFIYE
ncbi:hypothetical protein BGZ76_000717 [Entomortierella beljakovae]|nr:hypothetical protein BGZ76_000717 [Entomortierella beljakovae]